MNIHFTNEKLFDTLNDNTIIKIRVGSHMYGLDNKNSDIDYFTINSKLYPACLTDSNLSLFFSKLHFIV